MPILFQRGGGGKRRQKPEAAFQSAVITYLRMRYRSAFWHINHLGGLGQRAGIPDLLCCIRGRFVALELKSPVAKRPRLGPRQAIELDAILRAGGISAVVASWEDLMAVLATLDHRDETTGADK